MEQWRPVVGYEGCYEVSDKGNIRSIERDVLCMQKGKSPYYLHVPSKILKQGRRPDGYADVSLSLNGVTTLHCVHRLIAEAWLPNPDNAYCINHKDLDKTNNALSNLEWVSNSENVKHAVAHLANPQAIAVYSEVTREIYPSMGECDIALGLPVGTTSDVLKAKKPNKYKVRIATPLEVSEYADKIKDTPQKKEPAKRKGRLYPIRKIKCIDTQEEYNTLREAAQVTGLSEDGIRNSIRAKRACKGLTFYYLDDAPSDELKYKQSASLHQKKGKRI